MVHEFLTVIKEFKRFDNLDKVRAEYERAFRAGI